MTSRPHPPALFRRLLTRAVPPGSHGATILGDLLEEFRARVETEGLRRARAWYRWHATVLAVRHLLDLNRMSLTDRAGQHAVGAWRSLIHTRSTSVAAIASLGIAIGAATAIFSIINAVMLQPLPYDDADELVAVWDVDIERNLTRQNLSPATVLDYRALDVFDDIAFWWQPDGTLRDAGLEPARVTLVETSGNLFELLGIRPALGPGFPAGGPLHAPERMAVISDALWRERYGADPDIVGTTLTLDFNQQAETHLIVGVMPATFAFPGAVDVWARLAWDPAPLPRGIHIFQGLARLAPDVSIDDAGAQLLALTERLAAEQPDTNRRWRAVVNPLLDEVLGYYRVALYVMGGAVVLLLLAACLNVASLLLARGTARLRELALRAALGASRGRLVRQLLAESLLLSLLSTIAGVVGATWLLRMLLPVLPMSVPRLDLIPVDGRLLAFALGVTTLTTVVVGLMPAVVATRVRSGSLLTDGPRGSAGPGATRLGRWLVVGQITLACAILIAAGLLTQSARRMTQAASGISAAGVLTLELAPDGPRYDDWTRTRDFHAGIVDAMRAMPGIDAVGATSFLPLQSATRMRYARPEDPVASEAEGVPVQHISVDAGYFETVRATLQQGRFFRPADDLTAEPVMVINELLAREAFGDADPVGQSLIPTQVAIGPYGYNLAGSVPFRIIGVVTNVQQAELQKPNEPVMYFSQRQFPTKTMYVTARGSGADLAAFRAAVQSVDPSVPLGAVQWLQDWMLAQSAPTRLLRMVLTVFATVMAITAGAGVYGLLAFAVARQRREIAIRQALGATAGRLARQVVRQGVTLALPGTAAGVLVARVFGSQMDAFLFRTTAADPSVTTGAVLVVLAAVMLAAAGPARRAFHVDAAEGLRDD